MIPTHHLARISAISAAMAQDSDCAPQTITIRARVRESAWKRLYHALCAPTSIANAILSLA